MLLQYVRLQTQTNQVSYPCNTLTSLCNFVLYIVKFTRSQTGQLESDLIVVVLGSAADNHYVVGVQNIQDNEELSLQVSS